MVNPSGTEMATEITVNPAAVNRLQNFFNDPAYREAIESASNYNARLAAERTMRLPFLDSQTGVAQNHSNLWMDARQRIPGLREGQIYSYPAKRWRKKRRQYLLNFMQPRFSVREKPEEVDAHAITTVENVSFSAPSVPSLHNDDSKDSSSSLKDEAKQSLSNKFEKEAWYYDDLDIPDAGEFDEPDADSDYDYEESYSKRKKKRGAPKSPRGGSASRGSKRKITYDPITDSEKPFACDLCGARYKTRPGLTYHYTHSHKDKEDEDEDEMIPSSPKRDEGAGRRHSRGPGVASLPPPVLHPQQQLGPMQLQPPTLQPQAPPPPHHLHMVGGGPLGGPGAPPSPSGSMMPPPMMHHPPPPHLIPQQQPPPHHMSAGPPPSQISNHPLSGNGSPQQPPPGTFMARTVIPPTVEELQRESGGSSNVAGGSGVVKKAPDDSKPRVQPSTYCDFCLGDAAENKKSGGPEELVSCSDCGRSGHPTCLQFTANMIISVKKYRWQCIECKCCSICGTSDNDDQLLFCDDCDRGYHMYCLLPPLDAPPEGSWSCTLCLNEFHKK